MRKIIILVFIISFVGSASAAEVTYHFTAEIYKYSDKSGIFSKLGYSADMPLKGTITIDPETEPLRTHLDPYVYGAFGWWNTGVILFENQGYSWLDTCNRSLLISNYPSYRRTEISTKQHSLNDNPDVSFVMHKITLKNDELDAGMPNDLNVGDFSEYFVRIDKDGIPFTFFKANITSIVKVEGYTNSAEKVVDNTCPCDNNWKNHGAYVSCVARTADDLFGTGSSSQEEKGSIVSERAKSSCGKKK